MPFLSPNQQCQTTEGIISPAGQAQDYLNVPRNEIICLFWKLARASIKSFFLSSFCFSFVNFLLCGRPRLLHTSYWVHLNMLYNILCKSLPVVNSDRIIRTVILFTLRLSQLSRITSGAVLRVSCFTAVTDKQYAVSTLYLLGINLLVLHSSPELLRWYHAVFVHIKFLKKGNKKQLTHTFH